MLTKLRLDFEFFGSNEPHPTLVCAAFGGQAYWLLDGSDNEKLIDRIWQCYGSDTLLAYYAIAEARCFLALGIDPLQFKWIDLYAEFKMQQNCNNEFQYGHYLDEKGVIKFSSPPVYEEAEEEEGSNKKVPSNLINAVFKNTRKVISSKEKDEVRDIILSKDLELIAKNKDRIMKYCLGDIEYLGDLYDAIAAHYTKSGLRNFEKDMLSRGAYAVATAKCEQLGIPINLPLLNQIIEKTPVILKESQDIVNGYIPMFKDKYTPPPKIVKAGGLLHVNKNGVKCYARKDVYKEYQEVPAKKDTSVLQDFIAELKLPEWPKTEGGAFSTDKKTLETYRYIPAIETLYKHNKNDSSLKWFNKGNGDGFFEAFGADARVRPFFGIFNSQNGRNAAKAKTFPLAMSSWLRAIIQPPPGWYIIVPDWSQQEVAVAAALSGDRNLREAYESGDTYTAFAKIVGAIPEEGTKDTHADIREKFKSTKLGVQYGMGKYLMQRKLSFDCKRPFTLEEAQELINHHKTAFPKYWEYIKNISYQYQKGYPVITRDGWVIWQDNPKITSIRNSPVQGNSASITRLAVTNAWKEQLLIMFQLHDSLGCLTQDPVGDEKKLRRIMDDAVREILGDDYFEIRIDVKVISHQEIWVDKKGKEEWNKIKKHLILDGLYG